MSAITLDLTLQTADQATMQAALTAAGLWNAQGPVKDSHQHSLDVAGTLYAPDGTTSVNAFGQTVTNYAALAGYFAFLRVLDDASTLPTQLNSIIIDQPATTLRTWSGGSYMGPYYYDPALPGLYTE